jgi:hypothetical protein
VERNLQWTLARTDHTGVSGHRYGVRPAAEPGPARREPSSDTWNDRLLVHFLRLADRPDGAQRLLASADAVRSTIEQAAANGRYAEAVELARVAEPAFLSGARWGAWASVLGSALDAARAAGDRSAEGWALHQLGVRAKALGQPDKARELLADALAVRDEAGDAEAAAVTRSQLAEIMG